MIADMHSHILPAIDDGSSCLEESIELLRLEAQQGVTHVVATPHFYARQDRLDRFLARRARAEEKLRREMEKFPGLPQLSIGAEVEFFSGMSQSDGISDLTIDGKSCILVEMEELPWTDAVFRELERLHRDRGLTPIIAHVERYLTPWRNRHLDKLLEMPVLIQCNASFFLDRSTRSRAMRMLKNQQVHLLGSDCHNLAHRPPRLGSAVALIRQQLGQTPLERIESNQITIFGK